LPTKQSPSHEQEIASQKPLAMTTVAEQLLTDQEQEDKHILKRRFCKMSRINWTQVLVFGLVVLLVLVIGLSLLPMFFGGWGMMGRGGTWGGWCPWCGGAGRFGGGGMMGGFVGLLFMLLGLLIPIGLLGLLILGAAWLVRNIGRTTVPPAKTCPGCGRPTEPGWRHCPHCGKEL